MSSVFVQQPYYMPWLGFFAKMFKANVYVSLDLAKFRRNHLGRVRILGTNGEPSWLTCPVGASQDTVISSIQMPSSGKYVDKMLKTIQHSYGRADAFNDEYPFILHLAGVLRESRELSLAEANLRIIGQVARYLRLDVQILRESGLKLPQDRDDKAIAIMSYLSVDTLICGDGASMKVHDADRICSHGRSIELVPFSVEHPQYPQVQRVRDGRNFIAGLSFVDALLNVGREGVRRLVSDA